MRYQSRANGGSQNSLVGCHLKNRSSRSLRLLQRVKELDPRIFTKSGIMVGLGEDRKQVGQVMDDMRAADVDFLTIGQYLQPSKDHIEIAEFIHPDQFAEYKRIGLKKGFKYIASGPFVRSSYNAIEGMRKMKNDLR